MTGSDGPREFRLLISGGGTGGHVTPALAVIQAIQEMETGADWTARFLYVGSKGGVERGLVDGAGIAFKAIATGKLRRSTNPLAMLNPSNLLDLLRVPVGVAQAVGTMLSFQPDAVLSTGGYVSVPAVLAAAIAGVPVLAHEQTAQIGLGNRVGLCFVRRIALSFPIPEKQLPAAARRKAMVTGNPVRKVVLNGDASAARRRYGFDAAGGLPTIYVTGGAQGAHVINEAVREALPQLLEICRIIHQCGRQPGQEPEDVDTLNEAAKELPDDLRRRYAVMPFVGPEIGDVFALADLVVSRSGAGTVAEIALLGKPSLLVPLVPTGGDEQRKNARRFEELGAAAVMPSDMLTGENLLKKLGELFADRSHLQSMGEAARSLARPDAAHDLAVELLSLAGVDVGSGLTLSPDPGEGTG